MNHRSDPLDFLNEPPPSAEPQAGRAPAGGTPPQPAAGPFRFHCTSCGKGLMAQRDQAGKRFSCPRCKGLVVVPSPAETEFVAMGPTPNQPEVILAGRA